MFYIKTDKDFSTDRFSPQRFIPWSDGVYDFIDSQFLRALDELAREEEEDGKKMVLEEDGRPDLLSYHLYSTVELWWVLMYMLDKLDPTDLQYGEIVRYPFVERLEQLVFQMKVLQSQQQQQQQG